MDIGAGPGLKFVKAACEGDLQVVNVMRRSPQEGRLSVSTLGGLQTRIETFLECIAHEMGSTFTERDSVHLSASGWGALGMVFYDLHFNLNLPNEDFEKFSRAIGRIDWSRTNRDWIGYLGGSDDGKRLGKVFGGRAISRILDYVRFKVGLVPLLKAENVTVREDLEEKLSLTGASK